MIGAKTALSPAGPDFAALVDLAPVALLAVDSADRRIRYANQSAADLLASDSLEGAKLDPFLDPADFSYLLERTQLGETARRSVQLMPTLNANAMWAAAAARRTRWGKGDVVLLSLTDLREQKKLENELRASVDSLATSNADLEQFAYIASHDLQEPLRMIGSYMTLLKQRYQGKLDRNAEDFIDYAVDGASRLQHMINDLLIFSRVQTRGKELVLTSAESAFANATENLAYSISEAKAIITNDPLPRVLADATQLTMLFQNLLSNAIKFHVQDSPRIHVSVESINDQYRFCVQDNGIGIDPEFFDKIFLIFRRLHTRDEFPGTGIGLAVCKRIVSRHGGQIWVESQKGQGSRFYFTLRGGDRP